MSALTTAEKNALLDQTTITHVAAFNGDPAASGTEVGTDRGAITWAASTGGTKTAASAPRINVPAGATVTWYGFFDTATGGTLRGTHQLAAPEVFGGAGTLDVNNPLPSISATDA